MHLPRIGHRQVVYKNPYYQVCRVVANFGDFTKEYFVTGHGQRAGLVVVREKEVLLVRQYRLLIDRLSWEIPGGRVDDGETPKEAAIRECLEETGVQCRNLKPLLSYHMGLDVVHNFTSMLCTNEFVETTINNKDAHEVHEHV